MRQQGIRKQVMAVTVVLLMAFAAAELHAQQPDAQSTATSSQKAQPGGGPHEGIKVHGHWSIVIKNPDGSVASHREFENALVSSGADILAKSLARSISIGGWGVTFDHSQGGTSACSNGACMLVEASLGTATSNNLTVSYSPNPSRMTLQGSFQASTAGDLALVDTVVGNCLGTVTPSTCPSDPLNFFQPTTFSMHAVNPPMGVQSGQIVQVTVTFTFS